jgi:hypothetical protein
MIFLSVSVLFDVGQERLFIQVRHIPEWLPWLSYKRLTRYGYDLGQEVLHEPMEFVKETMVGILAFNDDFEFTL